MSVAGISPHTLAGQRRNIGRYDDATLEKELVFSEATGAYDPLTRSWLEELRAERKRRTLTCYACGADVMRGEATLFADAMDALLENDVTTIVDTLELVHCQGPPENFLPDGRVVICPACFAKGVKGAA